MEKWEYEVTWINPSYLNKILNECGSNGWELCSIDYNTGKCILKRKKTTNNGK